MTLDDSRVGWILAFALVAMGCGERAQLILEIDTDLPTDVSPPVAGDAVLRGVRVQVCDASCDDASGPRDEGTWAVTRREGGSGRLPVSLGVAPFGDDPTRAVEVRVDALRREDASSPDAVMFTTRRVLRFTAGQTVRVPIFLAARCVGLECPDGFACGESGECVPVEPDIDGGVRDAGAPDAGGRDGGPPDAGPPDAGPLDAGPLDAGEVDGGPPPCITPPPAGDLSTPTVSDAMMVSPNPDALAPALAVGCDGSFLYSVRSPTLLGASQPGHSIRRFGAGGWATDISVDTDDLFLSQVNHLAERAGIVYGAGAIGATWTFGTALTAPAPAPGISGSTRFGIIVFALDARDGTPLWVRVLKRSRATEFVGGIVADDEGVWIATRHFGSSPGSLQLDGSPWPSGVPIAGAANGYAHVLRFDRDGAPQWVRGITDSSAFPQDIALDDTGDGDVIVRIAGSGLTASLSSTLTGDLVEARLDGDGDIVWGRTLTCVSGSTSFRLVQGAVVGGRSWTVFGARSSADNSCMVGSYRIGTATPTTRTLLATGRSWIGILASNPADGEPIDALTWRANVGCEAGYCGPIAVHADTRGLVIAGLVGTGGVDFGGGDLPGRDSGGLESPGTDGFLVGLTPELGHVFSDLVGFTGVGGAPTDDQVDGLAVSGGRVLIVAKLSGDDALHGTTLSRGTSLVTLDGL